MLRIILAMENAIINPADSIVSVMRVAKEMRLSQKGAKRSTSHHEQNWQLVRTYSNHILQYLMINMMQASLSKYIGVKTVT